MAVDTPVCKIINSTFHGQNPDGSSVMGSGPNGPYLHLDGFRCFSAVEWEKKEAEIAAIVSAKEKVEADLQNERDLNGALDVMLKKAEAERDALRVAAVHSQDSHSITVFERDQARAENARLKARVEEAEKVIKDTADNGLIYWEPNTDRGHVQKALMLERTRAWLEEKV